MEIGISFGIADDIPTLLHELDSDLITNFNVKSFSVNLKTFERMWLYIPLALLIFVIVVIIEIRDKKLLEKVTKRNRGTKSERHLVLKLLKSGIPAQTIFHDLYIQKKNNRFSQLDLVVATRVGIIVLEVKDYSGWIFGYGQNSQWTQILAYGKRKYSFYNPIMQNNNHISDLKKQLSQFEKVPFYSVVVFYGDCVLKEIKFIPQGTYIAKSHRVLNVIREIIDKNEPALYTNKTEIVTMLNRAVRNGEDKETRIKHIKNIREMLGTDRIFE